MDDAKKNFPDGNIPELCKVFNVVISKKYYDDVLTFDFFENIRKFNKNVLIIHGTNDKLVPYKYGVKASEAYKNSKLIHLIKKYMVLLLKDKKQLEMFINF